MDAHAILQKQGWRGSGFSLDHGDRGLAKPLLVSHKFNQLGIGSKRQKEKQADQWWLNAFDSALKDLGSGKETALDHARQHGVNRGGLYGIFVRGTTLAATFNSSDHSSTSTTPEPIPRPLPRSIPVTAPKEKNTQPSTNSSSSTSSSSSSKKRKAEDNTVSTVVKKTKREAKHYVKARLRHDMFHETYVDESKLTPEEQKDKLKAEKEAAKARRRESRLENTAEQEKREKKRQMRQQEKEAEKLARREQQKKTAQGLAAIKVAKAEKKWKKLESRAFEAGITVDEYKAHLEKEREEKQSPQKELAAKLQEPRGGLDSRQWFRYCRLAEEESIEAAEQFFIQAVEENASKKYPQPTRNSEPSIKGTDPCTKLSQKKLALYSEKAAAKGISVQEYTRRREANKAAKQTINGTEMENQPKLTDVTASSSTTTLTATQTTCKGSGDEIASILAEARSFNSNTIDSQPPVNGHSETAQTDDSVAFVIDTEGDSTLTRPFCFHHRHQRRSRHSYPPKSKTVLAP